MKCLTQILIAWLVKHICSNASVACFCWDPKRFNSCKTRKILALLLSSYITFQKSNADHQGDSRQNSCFPSTISNAHLSSCSEMLLPLKSSRCANGSNKTISCKRCMSHPATRHIHVCMPSDLFSCSLCLLVFFPIGRCDPISHTSNWSDHIKMLFEGISIRYQISDVNISYVPSTRFYKYIHKCNVFIYIYIIYIYIYSYLHLYTRFH